MVTMVTTTIWKFDCGQSVQVCGVRAFNVVVLPIEKRDNPAQSKPKIQKDTNE